MLKMKISTFLLSTPYLRRESYSRQLPPHFLTISLKILFLDIFGHFLPFVPAHSRPLDPTSIFIDRNVITRCWCNYIYGEKATPRYYHPIFPPLAWKFYFWPFLAIFHHLCQRMQDPLIPSPFYWQKCYQRVLMKWYLQRESYSSLLQPHFPAICQKIDFFVIFSHFSPFVPAYTPPLYPTSTFIDKKVIIGCCCNDSYRETAY